MVLALPEILILCGLIVALGLIYSGKAYVDFFAWAVHKLGGRIPIIGNWISGKLVGVLQQLSNKLGGVAEGIGAKVAQNWHYLTTVVDRIGWTIFHTALAAERLYAYVTVQYPLSQAWLWGKRAYALARGLGHDVTRVVHRTTIVVKEAAHPGSTALGKGVQALTQPLRREVTALERATAHRLAVLAAAVADLGGQVAGWPHAAAGAGVGSLRGIRTRLRGLERATVGAGAAALVGAALAALGVSWIRCRNWRRAGKQVCQMDTSLLDSLLAGAVLVVGAQSVVRFADAMLAVEDEMVGVLEHMIVELGDVAQGA